MAGLLRALSGDLDDKGSDVDVYSAGDDIQVDVTVGLELEYEYRGADGSVHEREVGVTVTDTLSVEELLNLQTDSSSE